jgi:hypothetical protein
VVERVVKDEIIFFNSGGSESGGPRGSMWCCCRFNASVLAQERMRRNKTLPKDEAEIAHSF